ncbi:hypothetical protein [Marinobacterium aestuariivivens]|uniref:Thioredoxin domain-containing protein n=1 Tax=Marinobacterium aestuariivivens TaxID=1698799 RepID=A0ABW2A0Z3_9GAMM
MRKGTFWLIWGLGAGPLLLAVLMYWSGVGVPQGRTHHGVLLADGARIDGWQLQNAGGEHWRGEAKWQLFLTVPADCTRCMGWLERMPNLWTAIGKERERVGWHRVSATAVGDVLGSKRVKELGGALWVVDPLGNLVLRYDLDVEPQGVLEDMRRLLKLSKVG